jgi:hypothetical protein
MTAYTACLSAPTDGRRPELLVRRAVPAGVDGPCTGTVELSPDASMREAADVLRLMGFAAPALDDWTVSVAFDGLRLKARVERAR